MPASSTTRLLVVAQAVLQSRPQIIASSALSPDARTNGDWITGLVRQVLFQSLFDGTVDASACDAKATVASAAAKAAIKNTDAAALVLPLLCSQVGRGTAYELLSSLVTASTALPDTPTASPSACGVSVVLDQLSIFFQNLVSQ